MLITPEFVECGVEVGSVVVGVVCGFGDIALCTADGLDHRGSVGVDLLGVRCAYAVYRAVVVFALESEVSVDGKDILVSVCYKRDRIFILDVFYRVVRVAVEQVADCVDGHICHGAVGVEHRLTWLELVGDITPYITVAFTISERHLEIVVSEFEIIADLKPGGHLITGLETEVVAIEWVGVIRRIEEP